MGSVLLLCLAALLGLSAASSPSFCRGKPCPHFTTLSTTADYTIRKYAPSVWLEVHRESGENMRTIFGKLKAYFKANRKPMNVPIVGHLSLDGGQPTTIRAYLGNCTPDFSAPEPTDPRLHIHHDPELTYYVTPLVPVADNANSWRDPNHWKTQARALISKLPPGTQAHTDFCAAHYGPKKSPANMYAEIWVHTTGGHVNHGHNHGSSHNHGS